LHLAWGDWDEAARYLQESGSLAESYNDLQCLRQAGALLVERELLIGQPESAHKRLEALMAAAEQAQADITPLLVLGAWVSLERHDQQAAEHMAARGIERARASDNRFLLVWALRIQGLALTRRRRWSAAARALEEGLTLARAMPYPYAEARLLQVLGRLEAGRGNVARARQQWETALGLFERLGACKDADQTRAELMPR
jgi:tetratricopeptide (TPR) repeat protein